MQPTNSLPVPTLEQRLALLWIRKHQPVAPPLSEVPRRVRIRLYQLGLIQFDPNRRQFDTVQYCLTDKGNEVLGKS